MALIFFRNAIQGAASRKAQRKRRNVVCEANDIMSINGYHILRENAEATTIPANQYRAMRKCESGLLISRSNAEMWRRISAEAIFGWCHVINEIGYSKRQWLK